MTEPMNGPAPQNEAGKFDELVAAAIRTAVDEWRAQNDPADPHGVGMPEYIRQALADAGVLGGPALDTLRWLHAEAVWHAQHHRAQAEQLAADMEIRQGALNDVLGRDRSQNSPTDYYEAIEAVADLVKERRRLTARLEAEGLPLTLLRKGVRGLLDQVDAMARQIKALQAQLDQAHDVQITKSSGGSTAWCTTCRRGVGGDDEYAIGWREGHEAALPAPKHDEVLDRLRAAMRKEQAAAAAPQRRVWAPGSPAPDKSVTEVIAENDVTFQRTNRDLWHAKPPEGNGRDYAWAWINEHLTVTEVLPAPSASPREEGDGRG